MNSKRFMQEFLQELNSELALEEGITGSGGLMVESNSTEIPEGEWVQEVVHRPVGDNGREAGRPN